MLIQFLTCVFSFCFVFNTKKFRKNIFDAYITVLSVMNVTLRLLVVYIQSKIHEIYPCKLSACSAVYDRHYKKNNKTCFILIWQSPWHFILEKTRLICCFHLTMWIDEAFTQTKNINCCSFIPDSVKIISSQLNSFALQCWESCIINRKQISSISRKYT